MKRVCRTAIAWAIHVADDLRYFLKCSTDVCAKGSESPTKFQNLTVVSCSLFFSCDRKFRVMEKQTSEDTEEAEHFKSCRFEQVWAGLSSVRELWGRWGSWGSWGCRQRIKAARIKTRKGGTQRQGGQQLKSATLKMFLYIGHLMILPEWHILMFSVVKKQRRWEMQLHRQLVWGLWSRRLWRSCQKLDGIIAFGEIFAGQEAATRHWQIPSSHVSHVSHAELMNWSS